MSAHHQSVHDQFDPQAAAYLNSPVHANGPDLLRAQEIVAKAIPPTGQALDVGCGAGHLSFALAPKLARVVALDVSESMLATVQSVATSRGIKGIETRQAGAESLPFADATFCIAATRYSAHHWTRLGDALSEMRRVVRPGGYLLVIDTEGHGDALVDTHLQAIELLRDRSHVRNRSNREWQANLADGGFELVEYSQWTIRLDFAAWVARMRTPAENVSMIRMLQSSAPLEVQQALSIEKDGSFSMRTGLWWSRTMA